MMSERETKKMRILKVGETTRKKIQLDIEKYVRERERGCE